MTKCLDGSEVFTFILVILLAAWFLHCIHVIHIYFTCSFTSLKTVKHVTFCIVCVFIVLHVLMSFCSSDDNLSCRWCKNKVVEALIVYGEV